MKDILVYSRQRIPLWLGHIEGGGNYLLLGNKDCDFSNKTVEQLFNIDVVRVCFGHFRFILKDLGPKALVIYLN